MRRVITGKKVRLRDKRLSDVRNDYIWHKDPELASLDATHPTPLTLDEYKADYPRQIRLSETPKRHIFAIETASGEHIGNCAFYDIDEEAHEAEVGIMIGNRRFWDKGYGEDTLRVLTVHVFTETALERLYLKTLESNQRAQSCFKKCGFTPYTNLIRDGMSFVFMELSRRAWEKREKSGDEVSQARGGAKSQSNR